MDIYKSSSSYALISIEQGRHMDTYIYIDIYKCQLSWNIGNDRNYLPFRFFFFFFVLKNLPVEAQTLEVIYYVCLTFAF